MSHPIANKRLLAETTHELIRKSEPDLFDLEAVVGALAQVYSDLLGVDCTLTLKFDRAAAAQLLEEHDADPSNRGEER